MAGETNRRWRGIEDMVRRNHRIDRFQETPRRLRTLRMPISIHL
jgi:hypothetical protein